jgi:hypothetical protein
MQQSADRMQQLAAHIMQQHTLNTSTLVPAKTIKGGRPVHKKLHLTPLLTPLLTSTHADTVH